MRDQAAIVLRNMVKGKVKVS